MILTVGACVNPNQDNARAAAAVWFGHDNQENEISRVPGEDQSKQAGEIYAMIMAVRKTPPFAPLKIFTSKKIAESLSDKLQTWEQRGWLEVANKRLLQTLVADLRARGAPTKLSWAGNGTISYELAKKARTFAMDNQTVPPLPQENLKYNLSGAQISKLTQSLAYKTLRSKAPYAPRMKSVRHLDMTRYQVEEATGVLPTDATIWKSLRCPDLTRKVQEFLWKTMHNAHRCGDWWRNIANYEFRADCPNCKTEESIEHILCECDIPGQNQIWSLVNNALTNKLGAAPKITFGVILGCALINIKTGKKKKRIVPGTSRLFRILVSESAHLIWKLRCERVMDRGDDPSNWHSREEIRRRWAKAIDSRLALDQTLTDKVFGAKAIPKEFVLKTWSGALKNEHSLPEEWVNYKGGLVGIRTPELRPDRNRSYQGGVT